MRRRVLTMLAVVAIAGCAQHMAGPGWITLLDGTRLDGWDIVGDSNWRVAEGTVQADRKTGKDNGFLVSRDSYRDFELVAEFWASDDANSGIYMRCADPKVIRVIDGVPVEGRFIPYEAYAAYARGVEAQRKYQAATVFTDSREYPSFADVTGDFV